MSQIGQASHQKSQLIRIIHVLMLRLKTRHAALRTAVSAIMGRNMSHNIGSHVLARYGSAVRKDLKEADKDCADHRADWLSYLQRRMDFLAEIATADKAHWSQGLSLQEQVERLNYRKQFARFNRSYVKKGGASARGCVECPADMTVQDGQNEPILLRYITGKESMPASVEFGRPVQCERVGQTGCAYGYRPNPEGMTELRFSCPGGEVGAHALFVILENIIRNSARHGVADRSMIQIFVVAEDVGDRIRLTIIDPGTELQPGGRKRGASNDAMPLHEQIRNALSNSVLETDGSPNPKYWGIREMQICAHYLLGLPLSDLESIDSPVLIPDVYVENGLCCLKYELHLHKPRHVAVVRKTGSSDSLLPHGIRAFDPGGAAEIRDYEFAIWEEGIALSADVRSLLPVRFLHLKPQELNMLLMEKTDQILTKLHAKFIDIYTQEGTRSQPWGSSQIIAMVGWEPRKDEKAPTSRIAGYQVTERVCHIQTWLSDSGLVDMPAALCNTKDVNSNNHQLGIAWLDHPTDARFHIDTMNGFPQRPFFGGAALPCMPSALTRFGGGAPQLAPWIAVEPCWSDSPQKAILDELRKATTPLNAAQTCSLTELVCAAIPRIIVLDERVQSRRFDLVRAVHLYKYWPMVGIWAPLRPKDEEAIESDKPFIEKLATPRCDLDNPRFEDIHAFLNGPTPVDHQGEADFLVIHLTILERLNAKRREKYPREKLNDTLKELVAGTKADNAVTVVVTGRGVPTQARHSDHGAGDDGDYIDARFVPISTILEYLVSRPSKLGLMRVLWSA